MKTITLEYYDEENKKITTEYNVLEELNESSYIIKNEDI